MPTPALYQLLDFGAGRKLEQFGPYCLDRPCPAAESLGRQKPELWAEAAARYERTEGDRGRWRRSGGLRDPWTVDCGPFSLQLKLTPFGHVGMFPEQLGNWSWIARQLPRAAVPLEVLNLFAYTGGSTLAAAAAGAHVVHVDAARSTVQWARQNAAATGMAEAPIRWITDDARRFVDREIKRGRRYDAIVLDPPSYGKGPAGETWKLTADLLPLLRQCRKLLSERPAFVLLTCHSAGFAAADTAAALQDAFCGRCSLQVTAGELSIATADGRQMNAGVVARWVPDPR